MISRHVFAHHALLKVHFRLVGQPDVVIEYVIDTGFIGFLTLPIADVQILNLPFLREMPAKLADGSAIDIDVHAAVILWDGVERSVEVLAMGDRPLLGAQLLDGHELNVQFADGGTVSITDL